MRPGQDRHTIGALTLSAFFPDGARELGGVALGTPLTEVAARLGPGRIDGSATVWSLPVDDPHGNDRLLELRVHAQLGRAHRVEARLLSKDKLDVDAAWREVKDHLDKVLGAPDKTVTGVLTFRWRVPGAYEGRLDGSRYRNDAQLNVLDLAQRAADGVRFEGRAV